MFRLARIGADDGPMGSRQIADYLNARGIRTQTGGRWGVGAVHQILTRETYIGRHRFNVSGKRKGEQKLEDEIVDVAVEPIIDEEEFAEVQAVMRSRSPQPEGPAVRDGWDAPRWRVFLCGLRGSHDAPHLRQGRPIPLLHMLHDGTAGEDGVPRPHDPDGRVGHDGCVASGGATSCTRAA